MGFKVINKARQTIPVTLSIGGRLEYINLSPSSKNELGLDVITDEVTDTLRNLEEKGFIRLEELVAPAPIEAPEAIQEEESVAEAPNIEIPEEIISIGTSSRRRRRKDTSSESLQNTEGDISE